MSAASQSPDMLSAVLLKVRALAAGPLPAFLGTLVQGAWLRWVEEAVDPALSERLHAANQERPLTCSALWLPDRAAQEEAGFVGVELGDICWLRLTLLDGAFFHLLARQPLSASAGSAGSLSAPLRLNGVPFELAEMVVNHSGAGEAAWSGWTSYARLVAKSQARPNGQLERLTLEFDAPTAFAGEHQPWGRETNVLPEPLRVFGGLARRWQRFAPPEVAEAVEPEALSRYLLERVRVEEYALRTQRLYLRQARLVGFVGRCTYLLPRDEARDRLRRQVHLLADYAFYAGVGHKTAQGMGRARRGEE